LNERHIFNLINQDWWLWYLDKSIC